MPETILRYYKVFNKIKKFFVFVSSFAVALMILTLVVDIIGRNVFSTSLTGSYEIIEKILMPLAVFPALAFVQSSGIIPRIDMFVTKLHERIQFFIHTLFLLLEIFVYSLVVYYSWHNAWNGTLQSESFTAGGMLIPVYPLYYLVFIGFSLLVIEVLFILVKSMMEKKISYRIE